MNSRFLAVLWFLERRLRRAPLTKKGATALWQQFAAVPLLGVLAISCASHAHPSSEETANTTAALNSACDPAVENCCPSTGYTEQVLTEGPDTFSTAQPGTCVRALGGADTLMVGPGAYAIGGAGDDTINAWGGGVVVPGPGTDTVAISGAGTLKIFDLCEAPAGENIYGGGDGTLITPVPIETLRSRGIIVNGFSNIIVQQ